MTICGIELSASEARLVLLEGKKDDFSLVDTKPRKIKLNDEADQKEVKAFRDSIFAFLKENQVAFEQGMMLNMGQILSIPLVLTGIVLLVRIYVNKK